MPRFCWTDKAEESILDIGRYIIDRTQSRERGIDVINRIEEKRAQYAEFPESGTERPDLGPGLRCFPVENLIVVYRPVQDGIAIVLVAHGHQDLGTIVEKILGNNQYCGGYAGKSFTRFDIRFRNSEDVICPQSNSREIELI